MAYYYFINREMIIVYASQFLNCKEAMLYRDDVHPDCSVAVKCMDPEYYVL